MRNDMRAPYLKIVALVLVLLLANSVPSLSARGVLTYSLDVAGMDKGVNPGDDFFSYANGDWMKATKIPEDRSSYGTFDLVIEEVNQETVGLIKEADKSPAGSEARQVGDYYEAYMNEKAIEAKSLSPVKAELDEINAL